MAMVCFAHNRLTALPQCYPGGTAVTPTEGVCVGVGVCEEIALAPLATDPKTLVEHEQAEIAS